MDEMILQLFFDHTHFVVAELSGKKRLPHSTSSRSSSSIFPLLLLLLFQKQKKLASFHLHFEV
jgi:hypothetical protein